MDFILALLPWQIVYSLTMKRKDKFTVAIGLSLGILYVTFPFDSIRISLVLAVQASAPASAPTNSTLSLIFQTIRPTQCPPSSGLQQKSALLFSARAYPYCVHCTCASCMGLTTRMVCLAGRSTNIRLVSGKVRDRGV